MNDGRFSFLVLFFYWGTALLTTKNLQSELLGFVSRRLVGNVLPFWL